MKRRALLATAAAVTTTSAAGCLRNSGLGDSNPDENDGDTSDESTPEGTYIADQSFEVERVECGEDYGDHDVTTEEQTVTVEGVIDGNNTCYTAELVRSEYVTDEDTLYVEVESVDDSDKNEMCSTCIVEIEYMATFEFENGTPDTIRVDQRGQMSGSSSASSSVSATPPSETETATPESTTDN